MRACLLLATALACATRGDQRTAEEVRVEKIELAAPVRVGSLGPNFAFASNLVPGTPQKGPGLHLARLPH